MPCLLKLPRPSNVSLISSTVRTKGSGLAQKSVCQITLRMMTHGRNLWGQIFGILRYLSGRVSPSIRLPLVNIQYRLFKLRRPIDCEDDMNDAEMRESQNPSFQGFLVYWHVKNHGKP